MIENTNSKIVYQGDGEVRAFSVPFPFLKNADIAAMLIAADGTQTLLIKDTHYSIQVDAQGVSTLTLSEAPNHGWSLCIYRTQEITQEISLVENARFPSAVIESGFDRIVMAQQNQEEALQRALKAPVQETPEVDQLTLPTAALRKNSVLGWDAEGNMTVYSNPEAARQAAGHSAAQAALSENACAQAREATQEALAQCETLAEGTIENAQAAIEALEQTTQISDATMRAVSSFASSYAFRGIWSASTAPTPNLAGDWWIITGNCSFGAVTWQANDRAVWGGSNWIKLAPMGDYKTEMEARIQGDGNALTRRALELTSGYLTIPGSAPHLAKLPVSICFTYTKRGVWGTVETLFSNVKAYTRAGYAPKAGIQLQVQNTATPRTAISTYLNSQNLDNDAYSVSQFDLLPVGTHTVCVVIEPLYNNATSNSPTLPQKVLLYVDGSQWTPVNKNGMGAEYKSKTTAASTLESPCYYYDDTPPGDLVFSDSSQSSRANAHLSRIAVFNFALPVSASAATLSYRYSVEQYALGEVIPQRLLLGKNILADCVPMNPSSNTIDPASKGSYSWSGNTCTLTLVSNDDQPSQYNISWTPPSNIPLGAYLYFKVTISATNHAAANNVAFRLSGANSTYFPLSVAMYRDGVQVSTVISSDIIYFESVSGTHVYEGYVVTKGNLSEYISKFSVVCNTINASQGWQSGATITLNDIRVFGAITCLDQPFKGGNQLRDRGLLKLPGLLEGQTPRMIETFTYTDFPTWNGDNLPKALLSTSTAVIPANAKLTITAKPSAAVTLNVTNGNVSPTTWISAKTLTANVWNEVGSIFTTESSKLAIVPSAPTPYTGEIQVQVKIEPLL